MESKSLLDEQLTLEVIFQYLSAFELCKCASVCKFWNKISTAELNKRKKTEHFYYGLKDSDRPQVNASLTQCSMKNAGAFEEEFDQLIRNLRVRPAFCIAFVTKTLYENFEKFFPSHPIYEPKKKKPTIRNGYSSRQEHLASVIHTALEKRLPPNCQVSLYVGNYIVGTPKGSKKLVDQRTPAICGYFFSELPQQGIEFYRMRSNIFEVFRTVATEKNLKSALVLLGYNDLDHCAFKLRDIWPHLSRKGVVYPVHIGNDVLPLFFGPHVRTACFKTPFGEGEESQVIQYLTMGNLLISGTVALLFANDAEAFEQFCEDFHDKYPFIPVAGFFGVCRTYFNASDAHDCQCLLVRVYY